MSKLIIFLLFFLPGCARAQSSRDKIDSLRLVVKSTSNDTIRMDALYKLGQSFNIINDDTTVHYLEQSLQIAQRLKLKLNEALILQNWALPEVWNNYPKALELLLDAMKIADDPASEQNVWNLPPGHTAHSARLNTLGVVHLVIAQLYGNTERVDKEIASLLQAISLGETVGDGELVKLSNMVLGGVYFSLNKLDTALHYQLKAQSLIGKPEIRNGALGGPSIGVYDGWVFNNLGQIFQEHGNFDQARAAFQEGLKLARMHNNLQTIGGIYLNLSKFYQIIRKTDSSLISAFNALATYTINENTGGIKDSYYAISTAYARQDKTDSAFYYLKLATALNDSLHNVERKNLVTYQSLSFDEQMRLRNLEDEKKQTQNRIRMYAMLAGIIVFMLIASLMYRNSRNRKKANLLLQKQKEEIALQKQSLEHTLVELKSTQRQLIQSEKMASLGELTAGIAHEIQNPLNFVNNFSEVSKELLDEMKAAIEKGDPVEAKEIMTDVIDNLDKINHHGKRADAIVKGMLQHSRSSTGQKEMTDINALCDEYLRLAYHGLRAKDKSFNAKFETDFDPSLPKINIVPQEIGRVVLNLINNAFYAVGERSKAEGADRSIGTTNERKKLNETGYEPTVTVSTKYFLSAGEGRGEAIITVKDNGTGIPEKIKDKIFQPFFTTKPTGSGTGLGLSLAYDIVTKGHRGELKMESKEGQGTEFRIVLPV